MRSVWMFVLVCTVLFLFSANGNAQGKLAPTEYYSLLKQANDFYDGRNYQKAEELLARLVSVNAIDGDLWFKLGNAKYNLKKYVEAVGPFKTAVELGFYNKPVGYFRIARCYALSGDKEAAIEWLGKSLDAGYRNKTSIGENKDFEAIKADARFIKLIGAEKLDKLPRAQGWTRDIDYLVSEIKRTHYVYRKEPLPQAFNLEVARLKKQIPTYSDQRMIIELQHLLAMVGDGHTLVYPFGMRRGEFRQLPLTLYSFSDGLFVIGADEKNKNLTGKKIVKFGNLSTENMLEKLSPYVSRDNPMSMKWTMPTYLVFADYLVAVGAAADASKITLTLADKEGATETATVETVAVNPENLVLKIMPPKSGNPPPLYLSRVDDNYWFKKINDETVYFQFNQVANKKDESLDAFAGRLRKFLEENKTKNLIIDVRRNNGGESTILTELCRMLVNYETSRLDAKLYVLIGRNTYSAAQNFINTIEKMTKATFIGEPSGGKPTHIGDESLFTLPYSGTIGQIAPGYHQSANRDDRLWIPPLIPIELSSTDYFTNRDPVLEGVLKLIEIK